MENYLRYLASRPAKIARVYERGIYVCRCIVFDIKGESLGRKGMKKETEIRESE
ncbi:hypothetical protein MIDIC_110080 [Alphaproteobacteria bacterium]